MENTTQTQTIACIDVAYEVLVARAACVLIDNWRASLPVVEHVERIHEVNDYHHRGVRVFKRSAGC